MRSNRTDELIASFLTGEISREEKQELESWAAGSSSNAEYFDRQKEIWLSSMSPAEKDTFRGSEGYKRFERRTLVGKVKPARTRRRTRGALYAACAGVFAALAIFIGIKAAAPGGRIIESEVTVYVPEGSTSSFTLPDGTSVKLNSGSHLSYLPGFGKSHRDVRLDGEAYFDVEHDESIPFTVSTDRLKVTDLGTAFNIRNYSSDAQAQLALVEGKVEFSTDGDKQRIPMVPGETAELEKESGSASVTEGNIEKALGWLSGNIQFEDESLKMIARRLERCYGVTISIESKDAEDIRFTGSFDKNDNGAGDILEALSATGKIQFTRISNNHYSIK
ncbi:MAG: FecR domain-containing protein [Candidatus Cryptobacteroides sp.]